MALTSPQYKIGVNQPNGKQQYCLHGMYVGYGGDGSGANNNHAMNNLEAHLGTSIECLAIGLNYGSVTSRLALIDSNNPRHIVAHYTGMPSGGSLDAAIAGNYDAQWTADATAIKNSKYNTEQLTLSPWWEASAEGQTNPNNGFDWANGHLANTPAKFITAWRRMHDTFLAVSGFSTSVLWAWDVMSQGATLSNITAMYPGDSYVDIIGGDAYAGNHTGNLSIRSNYQTVWNTEQQPMLDLMTTFARTHSKLCGIVEYGQIQPLPGDTTSNTYKYSSTAPNTLYYPLMRNYMKANADVWAYLCLFNQNQKQNGVSLTSEEDQLFFCGTDPATQNANYYHSTNWDNGTWYDTIATSQQIPLASYKATMVAGTMQLDDVVPPTTTVATNARGTRVFNFFYPFG